MGKVESPLGLAAQSSRILTDPRQSVGKCYGDEGRREEPVMAGCYGDIASRWGVRDCYRNVFEPRDWGAAVRHYGCHCRYRLYVLIIEHNYAYRRPCCHLSPAFERNHACYQPQTCPHTNVVTHSYSASVDTRRRQDTAINLPTCRPSQISNRLEDENVENRTVRLPAKAFTILSSESGDATLRARAPPLLPSSSPYNP